LKRKKGATPPTAEGDRPEEAPGRVRRLAAGQLSALVGLMAAVFIAVVCNVLGARHYRRWDWTRGGLYSLSPATLTTLHDLPDKIEIWVLFGSQDPLLTSVKQLLVTYSGETTKLDVHYVDPDKDAIAFLDVRRRFKIEATRAEDGRVVTDASIVVARADKHWFLAPADLVEVSEADGNRAKPKEEQALTGAIRNVLSGEKARLCFTQQNDEMALGDPGPQGVGVLKDLLEKDNYAIVGVDPNDGTVLEPFKDCAVVVIAGPRTPFSKDAAERIKAYAVSGGNLLAGISPMGAPTDTGLEKPGLDAPLAMFGIVLDEDVVIEHEATKMLPEQLGGFIATPKSHPLTQGLVKVGEGTHEPPRVLIMRPRSMHHSGSGAPASDLLTTSPTGFGVTNVTGAAKWPFEGPEMTHTDLPGPLTLAMASEGPKEKGAAHGPRLVIFGSASMLQAVNWQEGVQNRGAAFLVENAISWLASKPVVLDVPDKPQVVAAIHLTDDARSELWRYVLLYMPLTAACAGILIGILRWASEGKKRVRA
jgi:ABC-type uncharacterized transport system